MAKKISGITVEIGGDTSKLGDALKGVNSTTKDLQKELRGVETLLKYDPKNVILLQQKQDILSESIENTRKKLDTLREAQSQVQEQFNKGEITVEQYRDFQRELTTTERRLNEFEEALRDAEDPANELADEVDELSDSAKGAGEETLTLGDIIKANLISAAIIGGVKMLASAMKSVVSGVIDLGKQSIAGYAEFEQLVGGVDTLFKESSQKVQDYANNAYKSVGLGANEYMETVTGFSASLLQSLGGDTDKAADAAHMAMIDMADNANKMGSSMESIQNAYSGFAKQNYTMLDNLKLGYGGTKSEMERLLADAQKFSGVKYDINNLKDVYEAIHVVQTEMGITGTTALEAEETISGSVNAMKSAYSNFVVGLADDNADLDQLIQNLIDSAMTVLDNVLPIIEQFLNSLIAVLPEFMEFIVQFLPDILEMGVEILKTLAEGILDAVPQLVDTALIIVNQLAQTLIEMLPTIIQVGMEMIVSLIMGIAESLPTLIPTIVDTVLLIVETLLDNIDMLVDAGIELIIALALGLIDAIPILIEKAPIIIEKVVNALIRNAPKLVQGAITLMVEIASGLIKGIPEVLKAIPRIIKSMKDALLNTDWLQVGKDIIKGVADGVGKMKDVAVDAVKNVGKSMFNGIKGFFGIKSPSTLMRDAIGKMVPQGVAVGVEADTDDAVDAIENMNKQMLMAANDPDLMSMMDGKNTFETQDAMQSNDNGLSARFDRLVEMFENVFDDLSNPNYQVVMNDGTLVGAMRPKMDEAFGDEQDLKDRGM